MTNNQQKTEYTQIVKSTGLFGGVQIITLLVSLVKNKVIAMLLGASGIGLISILNTIVTMVGSLTNIGISSSAVRELAEVLNQNEKLKLTIKKVRNWSLLTAIIGTLLGIMLSPCLSWWTFSNYDYTYSIMLLSPVIGLTAFSGGELALLKGLRKLRDIAFISIYSSILILCISLPMYYWLGMKGIVPSLLFSAIIIAWLTSYYSFKYAPCLLADFSFKYLKESSNLIRLGISMIFAAVLGSLVEYIIRIFMVKSGDTSIVGLYNAGYAIVVTYAGLVFTAMSTDYFPRLSAVNKDKKKMIIMINQQIEIALLLVVPVIVIVVLFAPLIVRILYAESFLPIVGMIQFASLNLLSRSFTWPIEYAALAKGNSMLFLFQEFIYDAFFVAMFLLCYDLWGITGSGLALAFSGLFNIVLVYAVGRNRYGYKISKEVFNSILYALPFYIFTIVIALCGLSGMIYWILCVCCSISCLTLSMFLLNQKTDIIFKLKSVLKKK